MEKIIDENKQGQSLVIEQKEGNKRKLFIESYGCAMNFSDSEIVASIMANQGFNTTKNLEEADLVLVNTCSIRDKAEQTVRKRLEKYNAVKKINPKITLLFTVSPIRHLKDGFVENMQSKSHLISAIHTIIKAEKNTHYFPSFEIMMDELRDYRFYKEDMIHPNATAINYIWERFMHTWVSEKICPILKEIDTIQKATSHKPFYPKSEAHQTFLKNIALKKEEVKKKLPFVKF